MQTLPFVPINLHRCWPREWKHSLRRRCLLIAENTYLHILQNTSCQEHSQGRRSAHPLHPPPRSMPGVRALGKRNIGENGVCQSTGQKNKGKGEGARYCYSRCVFRVSPATRTLAWESGVSGGKGERWKRKGRELKERNAWHRCFYWNLPPPHSMIRYHPIKITSGHWVVSFTCQKARLK